MNGIQAIETVYKGYRFRSRLEARWAVFFDALGIKWHYEPEGFALKTGKNYLPDFEILIDDRWQYVETKPSIDVITEYDTDRWLEFSKYGGLHVLIDYPGLPTISVPKGMGQLATITDGCWAREYFVGENRGISYDVRPWVWQERIDDGSILLWPCIAMEPIVTDEHRQLLARFDITPVVAFIPGHEDKPLDVVFNPGSTKRHDSKKLRAAYDAARSARFEHGESGAPVSLS